MNKPHQRGKAPWNSALGILEVGARVLGTEIVGVPVTAGTGATSVLCSFNDALIRFSRDHLRGEAVVPHYVSYLLAALNHQSALRYHKAPTEPHLH